MAVRVAVDALGGDRGPDEVVTGALEAAGDRIVPVLYGPASLDTRGLEHVVAEQAISTRVEAAEAQIRGASEAAMAEIENVAAEAAQDLVARLAGVSVSRDRAAEAVRAALTNG